MKIGNVVCNVKVRCKPAKIPRDSGLQIYCTLYRSTEQQVGLGLQSNRYCRYRSTEQKVDTGLQSNR